MRPSETVTVVACCYTAITPPPHRPLGVLQRLLPNASDLFLSSPAAACVQGARACHCTVQATELRPGDTRYQRFARRRPDIGDNVTFGVSAAVAPTPVGIGCSAVRLVTEIFHRAVRRFP